MNQQKKYALKVIKRKISMYGALIPLFNVDILDFIYSLSFCSTHFSLTKYKPGRT